MNDDGGGGDYCGCCGRDCGPSQFWCDDCEAHVLAHGPIEERTYFAQYDTDCPYQVKF